MNFSDVEITTAVEFQLFLVAWGCAIVLTDNRLRDSG